MKFSTISKNVPIPDVLHETVKRISKGFVNRPIKPAPRLRPCYTSSGRDRVTRDPRFPLFGRDARTHARPSVFRRAKLWRTWTRRGPSVVTLPRPSPQPSRPLPSAAGPASKIVAVPCSRGGHPALKSRVVVVVSLRSSSGFCAALCRQHSQVRVNVASKSRVSSPSSCRRNTTMMV